ncbi:hypothetical protein QNA23_10905 [Rhodococcus erythropolis]|uniref:hypothetical protein n=1 Tax=Rhodococcus erythropolis TaxID=1833 RepID=UPI0024B92E54|nr:hypothetical protein [Rhodococcus erythropolis]MDJ0403992.1 hypothetical protein [Rhodococcus erythropolis]
MENPTDLPTATITITRSFTADGEEKTTVNYTDSVSGMIPIVEGLGMIGFAQMDFIDAHRGRDTIR